MVVNGESRRVMVDDTPKPEAAQEPEKAKAPVAAKTPANKPAAKKPSLLERVKAAVTGKGKKA